jgi:hypothetical protein
MNQVTVYVDPVGCSSIGWTQAAGMPGDTTFLFRTPSNHAYPNIADMAPQLVLKPYTSLTISAYDIVINDPTGAAGIATIPGSVMVDRFHIEVYERNALSQPVRMFATGRIALNGYAYTKTGPLAPATYSPGPSGPAGPVGATGAPGPAGDPGVRGSRWYTGAGAPNASLPDVRVTGDMYLDETNGDVWRWDGASWVAFKGV